MEGIVECDQTFIWWWHAGRPKECWYYQPKGAGRIRLTELFGLDQWSTCAFVQFIMTSDDEVDKIRRAEPGVPNSAARTDQTDRRLRPQQRTRTCLSLTLRCRLPESLGLTRMKS